MSGSYLPIRSEPRFRSGVSRPSRAPRRPAPTGGPGRAPRSSAPEAPPRPRRRPGPYGRGGQGDGDGVLGQRPRQVRGVRPRRERLAVRGARVGAGGGAGHPGRGGRHLAPPVHRAGGEHPDQRAAGQPAAEDGGLQPARRLRPLVHDQLAGRGHAGGDAPGRGPQRTQPDGVRRARRLRPGQYGQRELTAQAGDHTEQQRAKQRIGRHEPILPNGGADYPATRPPPGQPGSVTKLTTGFSKAISTTSYNGNSQIATQASAANLAASTSMVNTYAANGENLCKSVSAASA